MKLELNNNYYNKNSEIYNIFIIYLIGFIYWTIIVIIREIIKKDIEI